MDVIEAIRTTRAMRRYSDEPVSDDEIWSCLRAAVQAPSGGNLQPWRFLVVRDAGLKDRLGDVYRRAYDRYEPALLASLPEFPNDAARDAFERTRRASRHLAEHLGDAQALVLFLMPRIDLTLEDAEGPLDIGTLQASVYPAVQNFMLAARALGIGTALTTVYRIYQDDARSVCGIPDGFEIAALVPMGRPRGRFGVAPRRPAERVTYWDRFGERRDPRG
jgi:nitroreductase